MSGSISRPNTNCPGVACSVILYEYFTAYAIEVIILLHGATVSNMTLDRSLVLSILPTTWWIIFNVSFSCGFIIVVHVSWHNIFEQWNEVYIEFRAIVEDYLTRPRMSWKPCLVEYLIYSSRRLINDRNFWKLKPPHLRVDKGHA